MLTCASRMSGSCKSSTPAHLLGIQCNILGGKLLLAELRKDLQLNRQRRVSMVAAAYFCIDYLT